MLSLKATESKSLTLFFFSSRRRHTRLQGDWSSDVCSSDLGDDRVREAQCRLHQGTQQAMSPAKRLRQRSPVDLIQHLGAAELGHDGVCQVDRKSTRLNSSHLVISYAVFCLKKKKDTTDEAIVAH